MFGERSMSVSQRRNASTGSTGRRSGPITVHDTATITGAITRRTTNPTGSAEAGPFKEAVVDETMRAGYVRDRRWRVGHVDNAPKIRTASDDTGARP